MNSLKSDYSLEFNSFADTTIITHENKYHVGMQGKLSDKDGKSDLVRLALENSGKVRRHSTKLRLQTKFFLKPDSIL